MPASAWQGPGIGATGILVVLGRPAAARSRRGKVPALAAWGFGPDTRGAGHPWLTSIEDYSLAVPLNLNTATPRAASVCNRRKM
jgi:hypothetical protein